MSAEAYRIATLFMNEEAKAGCQLMSLDWTSVATLLSAFGILIIFFVNGQWPTVNSEASKSIEHSPLTIDAFISSFISNYDACVFSNGLVFF